DRLVTSILDLDVKEPSRAGWVQPAGAAALQPARGAAPHHAIIEAGERADRARADEFVEAYFRAVARAQVDPVNPAGQRAAQNLVDQNPVALDRVEAPVGQEADAQAIGIAKGVKPEARIVGE